MATTTKLTLEQFLDQEEMKPAGEYVCGEVLQKPMPEYAHSRLQIYLAVVLFQYLAQSKLGQALTEFRCIFGPPGQERAFVPDVTYVARDRLTLITPMGRAGRRYLRAAPDLAIEILSPDQPTGRFTEKVLFYLAHGVRLVWIVEPATRGVTVCAPAQEPYTLSTGETLTGGDLLPGFSVALETLFAQADA